MDGRSARMSFSSASTSASASSSRGHTGYRLETRTREWRMQRRWSRPRECGGVGLAAGGRGRLSGRGAATDSGRRHQNHQNRRGRQGRPEHPLGGGGAVLCTAAVTDATTEIEVKTFDEGSPSVVGVPGTEDATLPVRIDGKWYNLRAWAAAHPAGKHWIHMYNMLDATEVFYAFHSEVASRVVSRMPEMKEVPSGASAVPDATPLQEDFRSLRADLVDDGWFERDWIKECIHLASYALLLGGAVAMAHCGTAWLRALAFLPLGCSHCYVGWLAHDYVHGRGKFCAALRNIGGWGAGFSAAMWSDKHNTHHAMTNLVGTDEDLSGGPLLWLWSPDPRRDRSWRRFQHLYVGFLFSLLHVVWRIDSLKVAWTRRLWGELIPIVGHYAIWLATFSVPTVALAVLFGGLLMANITSTTHQSEDLLFEHEHDWIKMQLNTTRNARCLNPFSEWIWGGMQYQIEHHLFPTMPRYRYPQLVPKIKALASRHGIEYRESTEFEIIKMNYRNYCRVAREPPTEGAPASSSGVTM